MSVLGSIIGAVGSLFGSSKNASSVRDTNRTNLQIAQMNNEFNERMLQKQMDYNTEMWNKQNEYNTASNQRARLEAAGLNPYMMMNGGSAGTAQSAQGVNPPTATPVTMQAPQYDLSTPSGFLQQAIELQSMKSQRDADANLKSRQAEQIHLENQYKAADMVSQIYQRMEETKNTKERTAYQKILNDFAPSMFSSDVEVKQRTAQNLKASAELLDAERIMTLVNIELQKRNLYWIDQRNAAEISSILANRDLSRAQASAAVQSVVESQARVRGINISNDVAERTADAIVKEAWYSQNKAGHEARDASNRADLSGYEKVARPIREGVETVGDVLDIAGKIKDISTPDLVNELKRRGVTGISFKH